MSGFLGAPPLSELVRSVRLGEREPESMLELSARALRAAEAGEQPINAFISLDLESVSRSDPGGAGESLPLTGIPVAIKDNIVTLGLPTTCGSAALEGYRSPYEATVVRRLRAAGARVIGKTNLDEFAMGSSTEHSAFGPTRNPVDRSRVPGGSSGGSAAAVASGIVPVALGSDTGGSVRQPAAFCGVVGLRPTYGRLSRYGLTAFASSLDQIGILGRTTGDVARVLDVLAAPDPRDATCVDAPAPQAEHALAARLDGLVVGVPREYFQPPLDPAVARVCREALSRLQALGAELRDVSLPHTELAIPAYYVIAPAEASTQLARFDGVRFGRRLASDEPIEAMYTRTRGLLGPEVRRRIVLGTFVLSSGDHDEYYRRAQHARQLIARDFAAAFQGGVDALFTPTTPTTAFELGARLHEPHAMYLSDAYTVAPSLAGLPALSVPIGRVGALPVGGQLIGPRWGEAAILGIARALESRP